MSDGHRCILSISISKFIGNIDSKFLPVNYIRFTIGQFISIIGSEVFTFGLGIWIFFETGLATDLVFSYLFAVLPATLLSPFVGVWVDKFNRIGVAVISDVINAVIGVLLVVYISIYGFDITAIYLTISIRGFLGTIQMAATSGLTVDLVPADKLTRANSFRTVLTEISRIIAPLLGAFVIIGFGITTAIVIDITSFIICIFLIIGLKDAGPITAQSSTNLQSYIEMIKEGYRFLKHEKVILKTEVVSMLIAVPFQFCSIIFVPLMLTSSGNNAFIIGIFEVMFATGAIVSGLVLLCINPKKQIKQKEFLFAIFLAAPLFIFAISKSVLLWCVAAFVWAGVVSFMCVLGETWLQKRVDSRLIGRVNTTISAIANITSIIPFLFAGFLVDRVFAPLVSSNSSFVVAAKNITGLGFESGYMLMCFVFGVVYLVSSIAGFVWISINHKRLNLK